VIARLDAIRERGYEERPSDTVAGVIDICFPVFNHGGVIAAVTVVYLNHRDVRASVAQARDHLRAAVESISLALGWLKPARA
jgi:DNA-binding IclR family transcriptional regulator